jgi:hypothetical protein
MLKQKIYTIPINEAFDSDFACPFCHISEKLDKEEVEYTLGAAMMEPDFRIITNEKGFCKQHMPKLIGEAKALPLSLVMQSQSEHWNRRLAKYDSWEKKKPFRKSTLKETAKKCSDSVQGFLSSCAICEKINRTMDVFFDNTIYLWKTEPSFKEKFHKKQFCLEHFAKLVDSGIDNLGEKDFEEFYTKLYKSQMSLLDSLYEDISEFTKMFDHRNSGKKPTPKVQSALKRIIHIYSGFKQSD